MTGFSLDLSVNLGQIMTLLGFVVTAMIFTTRLLLQITTLGNRLNEVEIETRKQTDILITMAETKVRLDNIEKRSDERVSMINQRILSLEQTRLAGSP